MFLESVLIIVTLLLRSCLNQSTAAPVVDLDYARYQGYYNSTSGLNIYKGYCLHHFQNQPLFNYWLG